MAQLKWPTSPIEELDLGIAEKVGRLSDGTATAEDVSEATRLIRKRADLMMPSVFRRLKDEGTRENIGLSPLRADFSWIKRMNMPVIKDGNGTTVAVAGAAVGSVLTFIGAWALFTYQFENGKVWDEGQAIIKLESQENSTEQNVARLDGVVGATQSAVNTILAQIGAMKTSNDLQVEAFHALEKRFDNLDDLLRPLRPNGGR